MLSSRNEMCCLQQLRAWVKTRISEAFAGSVAETSAFFWCHFKVSWCLIICSNSISTKNECALRHASHSLLVTWRITVTHDSNQAAFSPSAQCRQCMMLHVRTAGAWHCPLVASTSLSLRHSSQNVTCVDSQVPQPQSSGIAQSMVTPDRLYYNRVSRLSNFNRSNWHNVYNVLCNIQPGSMQAA